MGELRDKKILNEKATYLLNKIIISNLLTTQEKAFYQESINNIINQVNKPAFNQWKKTRRGIINNNMYLLDTLYKQVATQEQDNKESRAKNINRTLRTNRS